jgi:hypothetical protein
MHIMKLSSKTRFLIVFCALVIVGTTEVYGQHIWPKDADSYTSPIPGEQALGHWDITISTPGGSAASWLEIAKSGTGALVGRFVGRGGSARPVSQIKFSPKTKTYHFTIPPQWGSHKTHLTFKLENDHLVGQIGPPKGKKLHFTADRAPTLKRTGTVQWSSPIDLLRDGLSAWKVPGDGHWTFKNGVLIHEGHGGNIMTKQKFNDFKLHVEFRYRKGSNSGIYLRGRYELQVLDSYGLHTGSHMLGGIYGFISPTVNAAKKPGQWQTYDITLRGRMVTVVLNGKKIICNRSIPGITGGAIDSHEGQPGPIILQGSENGRIEYRDISITPAK